MNVILLPLLNGAILPSPEPVNRVVPLDLFPTSILDSVLVQKTYSAQYPSEFGVVSYSCEPKNLLTNFSGTYPLQWA